MANIKHGITTWVRHNQLPSLRGKRKVNKLCEELEENLIKELGGFETITSQQDILIRSTVKAYGVVLLTELYINKYSPLRPDKAKRGIIQYHPVLEKSYLSFLNSIRLNLSLLFPDGLSRQAEKAFDLDAYVKEKDSKKGENNGKE